MIDDEQTGAAFGSALHLVAEPLTDNRVEPGERLVEQQVRSLQREKQEHLAETALADGELSQLLSVNPRSGYGPDPLAHLPRDSHHILPCIERPRHHRI